MTAYTVSVTVATTITVTTQPETIIEHLTTVLFAKIAWWRGLRRGAVLPPIIK